MTPPVDVRTNQPFKLGCKKDKIDHRDYKLTRPVAVQLPPSIDYTNKMTIVHDQGAEGSCVGFACVDGMKDYQEKKEHKTMDPLSVRYVYWNAKQIDGDPDEEGTEIRCAMKILLDKGVCPESCWPYIPNKNGTPCDRADKFAVPYQIERYVRLETQQEMKESLVINGPFVAGILCFDGIFDASKGVVPMPKDDEQASGGHAICVVGYDDTKKQFKFKNSWGCLWGDAGYGYLSYDYAEKYLMDAWSAFDKLNDPPVPKPTPWERLLQWFKVVFGRNKPNVTIA